MNAPSKAAGWARINGALVVALALVGCTNLMEAGKQGLLEAGKQKGQDLLQGNQRPRPLDRYCDSLEESYAVVDNLAALMLASGSQAFLAWQRSGGGSSTELNQMVKEVSVDRVWIPVALEQQIGAAHHQEFPKENILQRGKGRRAQLMYEKADQALAAAVKEYPKLPYQLELFVVNGDVVNAEAVPGGFIYLTMKAVDLDPEGLQLVLGHEVAHVAKRHTSKQLQQRIVETAEAGDVLKHVLQSGNQAAPEKVFAGWGILKRLQGRFASYDQGQELQADACSIRSLVYADLDPLRARQEYLRKRGSVTRGSMSFGSVLTELGLGLTEHPDDQERDSFFVEATNFHRTHDQRRTMR